MGARTIRRLGTILVAASVIAESPVLGSDDLAIRVTPAMAVAPSPVRVQVTVRPDASHRELIVEADSEDFYRQSVLALDGAAAARVHVIEWTPLPWAATKST